MVIFQTDNDTLATPQRERLFQLAPLVEILYIEHDHILLRKSFHIYMYMGHTYNTEIKSQRIRSSRLRGHMTYDNKSDKRQQDQSLTVFLVIIFNE